MSPALDFASRSPSDAPSAAVHPLSAERVDGRGRGQHETTTTHNTRTTLSTQDSKHTQHTHDKQEAKQQQHTAHTNHTSRVSAFSPRDDTQQQRTLVARTQLLARPELADTPLMMGNSCGAVAKPTQEQQQPQPPPSHPKASALLLPPPVRLVPPPLEPSDAATHPISVTTSNTESPLQISRMLIDAVSNAPSSAGSAGSSCDTSPSFGFASPSRSSLSPPALRSVTPTQIVSNNEENKDCTVPAGSSQSALAGTDASAEANALPALSPAVQRKFDSLRGSIFGHLALSTPVLRGLAECCHSVSFSRGESLFRQGELADCFMVVTEGQVVVSAAAMMESRTSSPRSGGAGVQLSPSTALRRSSFSGPRGELPPPIASSGFLAVKSRRSLSSAASLPPPPPVPLSRIRECPVLPIKIVKSNLQSTTPFIEAEEDRPAELTAAAMQPDSESDSEGDLSPKEIELEHSNRASPVTASPEPSTVVSSAQSSASSSRVSPSEPPSKPLVLKSSGDVLGAESLLLASGSPDARRTYSTRCHSAQVKLLVVAYADFHRVLSASEPQTEALAKLLNHEWIVGVIKTMPLLRSFTPAATLLLAAMFRTICVATDTLLFKAGAPYTMDSSAFVVYRGKVRVSEAEETDSPAVHSFSSSSAPASQLIAAGGIVGDSALASSTSPRRKLSDSKQRLSSAGIRSCSARTVSPCILMQLSKRAFITFVEFASAVASDGHTSPLLKPVVPTLASILSAQAEREAASSPGGLPLPSSPQARHVTALQRYSDQDLLLHPLFQKVYYVHLQNEKGARGECVRQHELLEFWRDAVNYRQGMNKAQLSVGEEAAILARAYLSPMQPKFMRHIDTEVQQRINAAVMRQAKGAAGAATSAAPVVDRYLFLEAERATEAVLLGPCLSRFKLSPSFIKIAPFVKIDPKMLRKNEASRLSLTHIREAGTPPGTSTATASSSPQDPRSASSSSPHPPPLRPRMMRAASLPDYLTLSESTNINDAVNAAAAATIAASASSSSWDVMPPSP